MGSPSPRRAYLEGTSPSGPLRLLVTSLPGLALTFAVAPLLFLMMVVKGDAQRALAFHGFVVVGGLGGWALLLARGRLGRQQAMLKRIERDMHAGRLDHAVDGARAVLRRAVPAAARVAALELMTACALRRTDFEGALEVGTRARFELAFLFPPPAPGQVAPAFVRVALARANALVALGRVDEAGPALEEATQAGAPTVAPLELTCTRALYSLRDGRPGDALRTLEEARPTLRHGATRELMIVDALAAEAARRAGAAPSPPLAPSPSAEVTAWVRAALGGEPPGTAEAAS